jgi:hypothetical protein
MQRRFLIALLAFGAFSGFAGGFASLGCHSQQRHDAFERHIAQVCVDAARGAGQR